MSNRQLFQLFVDGVLNSSISPTVLAFVIGAAKQPDVGSGFDLATRDIRDLATTEFLEALKARQYNAFVATIDGRFAGLLGYQKHDASWRTFAFVVPLTYWGQGIATAMASLFLLKADEQGATSAFIWGEDQRGKLSAANHRKMVALNKRILENRLGLPFPVARGTQPGELIIRPNVAAIVA